MNELKDCRISFSKWTAFLSAFIIGAGVIGGMLTVIGVAIVVLKVAS